MAETQYALLALIPAAVAGLYFLLYQWRFNKFANIPSPLKRKLFIGHLGYIADEYKRVGSAKVHPGKCLDCTAQSILD